MVFKTGSDRTVRSDLINRELEIVQFWEPWLFSYFVLFLFGQSFRQYWLKFQQYFELFKIWNQMKGKQNTEKKKQRKKKTNDEEEESTNEELSPHSKQPSSCRRSPERTPSSCSSLLLLCFVLSSRWLTSLLLFFFFFAFFCTNFKFYEPKHVTSIGNDKG